MSRIRLSAAPNTADHRCVRRALCCLCALFVAAGSAYAQPSPFSSNARIDWTAGTLSVVVTGPINGSGPAAVSRAQARIRREAGEAVRAAITGVRLESRYTIGERAQTDRDAVDSVLALVDELVPTLYRPHLDLSEVDVHFTMPLFPTIGEHFATHTIPREPPRQIGYVVSQPYTGVVIYAADPLPLHGTDRVASVLPALFPGLYDEQMRLLVEREYYDPAYLNRWGAAAYMSSLEYNRRWQAQDRGAEQPYQDRIGDNPLRILARGVFGIMPTDPIISQEAARILLSEPNRHLLTEGRILIIIDAEHTVERADS